MGQAVLLLLNPVASHSYTFGSNAAFTLAKIEVGTKRIAADQRLTAALAM